MSGNRVNQDFKLIACAVRCLAIVEKSGEGR